MPTVILLDVSLSMCRPATKQKDTAADYNRLNLAVHGINTLLDHCAAKNKLEFFSLIVFSSLWEQLVPFTREYDKIKDALTKLQIYDKTCIETAIGAATSLLVDEWGYVTPSQVLLVTDGNSGMGEGSLKSFLVKCQEKEKGCPLPFPFPSKLHVICLAPQEEINSDSCLAPYNELVKHNLERGKVWHVSESLTTSTVQDLFSTLSNEHYTPHTAKLNCGNLQSNVHIIPAPERYLRSHDFENIDVSISDQLHIVGFMDIADVASPPSLSRHLVIPSAASKHDKDTQGEEDADGNAAEFTVLLHGSLKVENMVALVKLSSRWFGMIYSWADSKKKSNLMLSIFTPGNEVHAWLGNFQNLAPIGDFIENPYGTPQTPKSPFPVRPAERRSYSQNCVVWIKATGLQAEVQKILRHARKLPEKLLPFYKELNRVRRAILSFGFLDMLSVLGDLFDREILQLSSTNAEAIVQLKHAAQQIRDSAAREYDKNIAPVRTTYNLQTE